MDAAERIARLRAGVDQIHRMAASEHTDSFSQVVRTRDLEWLLGVAEAALRVVGADNYPDVADATLADDPLSITPADLARYQRVALNVLAERLYGP